MVPEFCASDGCDKPHYSRFHCRNHYAWLSRRGQLPPLPTVAERFWAKVDTSGDCWEWTASRTAKGYGQFNVGGKCRHAHRYSFVLHNGAISDELLVDHRCRNRACVNPSHLRAVTTKQNEENRGGANSDSATGILGVSWSKTAKKWVAQVQHEGKNYRAGYFTDITEAEAAAVAMRLELFTHNDRDRIKMEAGI